MKCDDCNKFQKLPLTRWLITEEPRCCVFKKPKTCGDSFKPRWYKFWKKASDYE